MKYKKKDNKLYIKTKLNLSKSKCYVVDKIQYWLDLGAIAKKLNCNEVYYTEIKEVKNNVADKL